LFSWWRSSQKRRSYFLSYVEIKILRYNWGVNWCWSKAVFILLAQLRWYFSKLMSVYQQKFSLSFSSATMFISNMQIHSQRRSVLFQTWIIRTSKIFYQFLLSPSLLGQFLFMMVILFDKDLCILLNICWDGILLKYFNFDMNFFTFSQLISQDLIFDL
jgi:hypothetical protein